MLGEPVAPKHARNVMTNSSKFAHYGPGIIGRQFHFGALLDCIEAARFGKNMSKTPRWLLN
jgi:predicted aconitase